MKNAFGLEVYEIKHLFRDSTVEKNIYDTLSSVLSDLGVSSEESGKVIKKCFALGKNYDTLSNYESKAHRVLREAGIVDKIPRKLLTRSVQIFFQIKKHQIDGSILDLGCGDGKVGKLLANNGHKVVLADIYKNPHIDKTGLEFRGFEQENGVPAKENEFDNCLALTVFHHSDDPLNTIKEIYRVTRNNGRVVVIESIYGVDGSQLSEEEKQKTESYTSLSYEQQRLVNIFFDHFYNRLINYNEDPSKKANVPYNFNTPEGWKEIFEENGFKQEQVIHLGVDQSIVPEYHTLHVLKVIK